MKLWRISEFTTLSGEGGLLASGRWHSRGHPVVYLSDHPASALLETIVRLQVDPEDLPDTYKLLTVETPDDIAIVDVEEAGLAAEWRSDATITRNRGDDWLIDSRTALLRVPSALVPFAFNFLLNPLHPDCSRIRLAGTTRIAFDPRLLR